MRMILSAFGGALLVGLAWLGWAMFPDGTGPSARHEDRDVADQPGLPWTEEDRRALITTCVEVFDGAIGAPTGSECEDVFARYEAEGCSLFEAWDAFAFWVDASDGQQSGYDTEALGFYGTVVRYCHG